jgi:hypothetical protein
MVNRLSAILNFDPTNEEVWKRPPASTLVIEHIYGVQTSDRRSSIMYMHIHSEQHKD